MASGPPGIAAADCLERFQRVQEILDRNKCVRMDAVGSEPLQLTPSRLSWPPPRLLISEINANHESKRCAPAGRARLPQLQRLAGRPAALVVVTPCPPAPPVPRSPEALQHNVVLIRELNSNIARIVQLYRDLSNRCATWGNVRTQNAQKTDSLFAGPMGACCLLSLSQLRHGRTKSHPGVSATPCVGDLPAAFHTPRSRTCGATSIFIHIVRDTRFIQAVCTSGRL